MDANVISEFKELPKGLPLLSQPFANVSPGDVLRQWHLQLPKAAG
jgi:hypothetical protein